MFFDQVIPSLLIEVESFGIFSEGIFPGHPNHQRSLTLIYCQYLSILTYFIRKLLSVLRTKGNKVGLALPKKQKYIQYILQIELYKGLVYIKWTWKNRD